VADGLKNAPRRVPSVNANALGVRTDDALYRFLDGFDKPLIAAHQLFSEGIDPGQAEQAWQSWLMPAARLAGRNIHASIRTRKDKTMATRITNQEGARTPGAATPAGATRRLLACGTIAGPMFVGVVVIQGLTRSGFDFTRDPASLLDDGSLGWIQITNFALTGLLIIAFAAGMRRVLSPGRGGIWGPRLVGVLGLGSLAAGIFRPDPADGFPPGAPAGGNAASSWHGMLHMTCSSLGFLALIAACFVVDRRFSARGQRGWAAYSRISGVLFLTGFAAGPSGTRFGVAAFGVGVVIAMTWLTLLAVHLRAGRHNLA